MHFLELMSNRGVRFCNEPQIDVVKLVSSISAETRHGVVYTEEIR